MAAATFARAEIAGALGLFDLFIRVDPAQVIERGFLLAHLGGDFAVADRLARLPLQGRHLACELGDHVFQPLQIVLGAAQAQFRLMAAHMQAGNAGGIFQHAAALVRLGLDDLADPALMHERGRTRAGRGIGKQKLDVARAHFAAVDAVAGALLALDAARDFDRVAFVEGGRCRAIRVVDRHRDFGIVAARPVAGAGKDHRIHV
jgi:hypothetical protein